MSQIRLINHLARPLAIASVAGAALLAGSMTPVMAQSQSEKPAVTQSPTDSKKPPAAAAATSSKPETVEQRIDMLKSALKITPQQESKWDGVAQAMRDNASRMEKLVAEKRKLAPDKTTAVDDLKTYQDFAQAHLDGIKHLTSSFKSLYDAMSPDQKKNADQVFESYGTQRNPQQG
jgi:hypothetical protein